MGATHDEVAAALVSIRARWMAHVTYARFLPDIAASGGLLSNARRQQQATHSWGANERRAGDRVCLSLMVSWEMVFHKMNGHELVVLVIDTARLPDLSSVWVTPVNSAAHAATRYLEAGADPLGTIAAIGAERKLRAHAELLVAGGVPLGAVTAVLFCDEQARDTWWPPAALYWPAGRRLPELPLTGESEWWRLPPEFAVSQRTVPQGAGRDQLRPRDGLRPWPSGVPATQLDEDEDEPHWMDLDDWDRPEDHDGPPRWSDFYEDGEPDDPDWYEPNAAD